MNLPLISVIVPVYNCEPYLLNTLNALLCQSYKNLEVIIVDDGSVDNSGKIAEDFCRNHSNFTLISQENSGVSVARNRGIKKAQGQYIGFCDGDDIPDNDFYETLYNLMLQHNADISSVDLRFVNDKGVTVYSPHRLDFALWESSEDFAKSYLLNKVPVSSCTKLFKSEICKKVLFVEGRNINEDTYFCYQCAIHANRIVHKGVAKYAYIRHSGSNSNRVFTGEFFDLMYFADKIVKSTENHFPNLVTFAYGKKLFTALRLLNRMYVLGGKQEFKQQEKQLVKYIRSNSISFAYKHLNKTYFVWFLSIKISRLPFRVLCKFFKK